MKFGIIAPYAVGHVEEGAYAAEFARIAEDHGLESLWTVEHVLMTLQYDSVYPYDPSGRTPFTPHVAQPDPLVWLGYVAAATKTIRLATGVLNLPQRNPFILAKEIATLDRLSGGRMELGVGVGWVREEAEIIGANWEDRGKRANEYIEILRALWSQDVSAHTGSYHTFREVVSLPKPLQAGGVPIVIGGHSPAAARRAGRYGDGFFPLGVCDETLERLLDIMRSEADAAGRDPEGIELSLIGMPDLRSAEAAIERGADRMIFAALEGDLVKLGKLLDRFLPDVMERL